MPPTPPPILQAAAQAPALAPQTVLAGRYRIIRALTSGGMGAIYLASDSHLGGRRCALKEMLDRFASEDDRREGQQWFAREAQTLGRLRHPAIPEIYDSFIEDGRYYLSLEFIDGENLEDRVARLGSPGLPEREVLEWAAQICDVLRYLHEQQPPLVFRDLKPANVMLARDNTIRLVDFGIARGFSGVRQATLVGTPGYCPPEQYQGLADPMSDIYALAATLHHLLSGQDPRDRPPFVFPPIRARVRAVSEATECLLEGALRLELGERGPDVLEFGRQARRIAGELAQGFTPTLRGARAVAAPGDPLPPTRMVVPTGGVDLGRRTQGEEHTVSLTITNEGPIELRTVLHASVGWLSVPEGQVRVPCGSTAQVPVTFDAGGLPLGRHRALIELDGNGGTLNVPVEVHVAFWFINGMTALVVATGLCMIVLLVMARVIAQHL